MARVAPAARIDSHAQALSPLRDLVGTLRWLALGLVFYFGYSKSHSKLEAASR